MTFRVAREKSLWQNRNEMLAKHYQRDSQLVAVSVRGEIAPKSRFSPFTKFKNTKTKKYIFSLAQFQYKTYIGARNQAEKHWSVEKENDRLKSPKKSERAPRLFAVFQCGFFDVRLRSPPAFSNISPESERRASEQASEKKRRIQALHNSVTSRGIDSSPVFLLVSQRGNVGQRESKRHNHKLRLFPSRKDDEAKSNLFDL